MPDVVYILGHQSEYEELRCSLRSLRFIDHDQVHIIGAPPPDWCSSRVNHIPVPQLELEGSGELKWVNRKLNQRRNLLAACDSLDVADNFVFMNDDFIFVKDVGFIPPPHRLGTFDELFGNMNPQSGPNAKLYYWWRDNPEHGVTDPVYVPEHIPMVVNGPSLGYWMKQVWHIPGFEVASLWANNAHIETYPGEDFILKKERHKESWPKDHWAVSTVEYAFHSWPVGEKLRKLHDEPSPYER